MRGGERSSGGVPEQDRQGDETHRHEATDGPYVASMTSRNVPERMNELNDRAIRPFNTTTVSSDGSTLGIPAWCLDRLRQKRSKHVRDLEERSDDSMGQASSLF
jgi:hypothetical protein